jgi:predicted nucleotidyltransferase
MEHAVDHGLPNGGTIKLLTAPYFLATKLEAFKDRGEDMRTSKDFEDIIFVLDGRLRILEELQDAPLDVRGYLRREFNAVLERSGSAEAIAGHLDPRISDERSRLLLDVLRRFVAE